MKLSLSLEVAHFFNGLSEDLCVGASNKVQSGGQA